MTMPAVSSAAEGLNTEDPAVARILDAALELFEDVGIRKSTIEDIARRAGIDRVTVYRRIGSKDAVAKAVMTRESERVIAKVTASAGATGSLEDRVVAAFTTAVLNLRDHALLNRLIRLEPNETLPKVTSEASQMLATGIHWTVEAMLIGEDDAEQRRADLIARAEIIGRVIHSMVLTKHAALTLDNEDQLTEFARTYIAPIAIPTTP